MSQLQDLQSLTGLIMKKSLWLYTLIFGLLFESPTSAQNKVDLALRAYESGNLSEARRILSEYITASPRDGNALFYMGKLEPDGEVSIRFFKDVRINSSRWEKADMTLLSIIEYNYAKGLYLTATSDLDEFIQQFENSPYLPKAYWLLGSCHLATDQIQSARENFDKVLQLYPNSEFAAWAQVGKGDCFFSIKDYKNAILEYQKVIGRYNDSPALSLALLQLYYSYIELKDEQNSYFYQNLYNEKFSSGFKLGQSLNETFLPSQSTPSKKLSEVESSLNVVYTVQIGVFAERKNAFDIATVLKSSAYTPSIFQKKIQDKTYYVVQVGDFKSLPEAIHIKENLEKELGGSYRVVMK